MTNDQKEWRPWGLTIKVTKHESSVGPNYFMDLYTKANAHNAVNPFDLYFRGFPLDEPVKVITSDPEDTAEIERLNQLVVGINKEYAKRSERLEVVEAELREAHRNLESCRRRIVELEKSFELIREAFYSHDLGHDPFSWLTDRVDTIISQALHPEEKS